MVDSSIGNSGFSELAARIDIAAAWAQVYGREPPGVLKTPSGFFKGFLSREISR